MLQTNELRHRLPPILQALQACSLHSRTPVTALRKKPAPYHSWGLLTEPEDAPGWTPFTPGDAIGGEEAHFCFRGPVAAPAQAAGRHLVCLVSTGATDIWNNNNPQFLAYLNGELVCGLDVNHTEFDLTPCARPGDSWQLGLYAYCNTPAQDVFLRVETAVREDEVTALYYDLKTPFEAMALQDPGDPNALTIARCLDRALALLDLRRPGSEDFFRRPGVPAHRVLRGGLRPVPGHRSLRGPHPHRRGLAVDPGPDPGKGHPQLCHRQLPDGPLPRIPLPVQPAPALRLCPPGLPGAV